MTDLTKVSDLSNRYGVSTRTLRYYEEVGLIKSLRTDDYAYRMYDDANIKKLEQIIILRKLNITIKDIQRVFAAPGSEVLLEVLRKKVEDIDEEAALLHEFKKIVLDFIVQIKDTDFTNSDDIKLLYEKAKDLETRLISPIHRLFEISEKLEKKAISRLQIPDNVLKRLLQNVYFILGDGASVADELGRKYDIFVYHTCNHRHIHFQNAEPQFQPELSLFAQNTPDFFAQDPEDAMRHECGIVRDFTPMVIMDLIQLSSKHEKIICENDIDIDSIIQIVTNAVVISNDKSWDDFIACYENEIRRRDIPEHEKKKLIRKVNTVWENGKPENPRGVNRHGLKQVSSDDTNVIKQTADIVADYFGFHSGRTT